jgi:hypothetical protein
MNAKRATLRSFSEAGYASAGLRLIRLFSNGIGGGQIQTPKQPPTTTFEGRQALKGSLMSDADEIVKGASHGAGISDV